MKEVPVLLIVFVLGGIFRFWNAQRIKKKLRAESDRQLKLARLQGTEAVVELEHNYLKANRANAQTFAVVAGIFLWICEATKLVLFENNSNLVDGAEGNVAGLLMILFMVAPILLGTFTAIAVWFAIGNLATIDGDQILRMKHDGVMWLLILLDSAGVYLLWGLEKPSLLAGCAFLVPMVFVLSVNFNRANKQ